MKTQLPAAPTPRKVIIQNELQRADFGVIRPVCEDIIIGKATRISYKTPLLFIRTESQWQGVHLEFTYWKDSKFVCMNYMELPMMESRTEMLARVGDMDSHDDMGITLQRYAQTNAYPTRGRPNHYHSRGGYMTLQQNGLLIHSESNRYDFGSNQSVALFIAPILQLAKKEIEQVVREIFPQRPEEHFQNDRFELSYVGWTDRVLNDPLKRKRDTPLREYMYETNFKFEKIRIE